jgi:hypothetical protein
MLLTGRSLFRIGGQTGEVIPPDHACLPETLRGEGYRTHHIGKWHQDRDSFHRSFDGADRIFGFTPGWYVQTGGHWNVAVHDFDPSGEYPEDGGYLLDADKQTKHPVIPGRGGVHSSEMFSDAGAFERAIQRERRIMAKAKKPAGKDSAKPPAGIPDFEALIRKVGDRAMARVEEEVKEGKISPAKQPGGDQARGELPEPSELCSNLEDAERFAEAARQAFREAHPPSRVDEIMAEAFRKAEQAALAKERVGQKRILC